MEGTRDNDLFHAANCLVKGGMHSKDINQIIEILAKSCSPPFSENEVKIKIDSALQRAERRERNIMEEVREWVLTTDGHFLTTNCHNETTMTTSNHKKSANMALLRLVEEGVLEKYGERRGCYRLVDKKQAEMNFIEYEIYEFPVKLPFGLNDLCSLYPKNIIVVAGSKSSGKTALLLNIAKENQNKFDIVYLNSEMGDEEWTMRLKNLGVKNSDEIKFKAFHCNKNFHDRMDNCKRIS